MEPARQERRALVCGLVAVFFWSTVATAFKLGLRHLEPAQLLLVATAVSLVVLGVVIAARGDLRLLAATPRRELIRAAGLGLLNPWLYYLVLFEAYDRLPAQVAQPLNFTWALTLSYLAVPLLGHKLRLRDVLAGLVCYGGVVVISRGNAAGTHGGIDPVGVALALGSTVIWSFYWLLNARSRLDPVVGLFWNFAAGIGPVAIVAFVRHGPRLPAAGWPAGVYVGVFEMGVTFVLWLTALRLTRNTSRIANLIFLAPFLSLIFIGVVLGEPIRLATVLGLVLIVGGLVYQSRGAPGFSGGPGDEKEKREEAV